MKIIKGAIVVLILVGLAISVYLTSLHYAQTIDTQTPTICGASELFSNCGSVLRSEYSEIYGVPMALLGVFFYLSALILIVLTFFKNSEIFVKLLFWLEVVGLVFSGVLTYLQFFVLKAVCPYCLTSAIVTLLVFCLSFYLKKKLC